jgi:hypothetical protein
MGGGPNGVKTSNVTFTNDEIRGTAGGKNVANQEQGNTLVTIDSDMQSFKITHLLEPHQGSLLSYVPVGQVPASLEMFSIVETSIHFLARLLVKSTFKTLARVSPT